MHLKKKLTLESEKKYTNLVMENDLLNQMKHFFQKYQKKLL